MQVQAESVLDELRGLLGPERAHRLDAKLGDAIAQVLQDVRDAMPGVEVGPRDFAERIYAALESESVTDWAGALRSRHPADLYLCAGLIAADPGAAKAFEGVLRDALGRVQHKFKLSEDARNETMQKVRIRLLIGEDGSPARIAGYNGQASLRGWIRTAAGRLVINEMRAEERHRQRSAIPQAGIQLNADTLALKQEQREVFGIVLREAFEELEPKQRTLLRMRYVENVQATELARLYAVHESTMSRWLSAARDALSAGFERGLVARRSYGVESLMGALASGFDQSLAGLFATSGGSES